LARACTKITHITFDAVLGLGVAIEIVAVINVIGVDMVIVVVIVIMADAISVTSVMYCKSL
jgi:hypothetical protein